MYSPYVYYSLLKMFYVYIDDIMGGLHASDLVVLMEVSQTTL